jgi:hypothetical protein
MKSILNLTCNLYLDPYMDCHKKNSRLKRNDEMITSRKDFYKPHPPWLPPQCTSVGRRKANYYHTLTIGNSIRKLSNTDTLCH